METRTLSSVLASKLADLIEVTTFRDAARTILLFFLAGILSAAVVSAGQTADAIQNALLWHESAVLKVVLVFLFVFKWGRIWDFIVGFVPEQETQTMEGIPTVELIDHLFTEKTFRRDDIEAKFQVPRHRVVALTKRLKEIGVLTHGENNMSVLNEAFSRQDVASVLAGCGAASEIQPLFRRDELGLTSRPSGEEIRERATLPRSPGFVLRKSKLASGCGTTDEQPVCDRSAAACATV